MKTPGLSYNSRKALIVNIGETAGTEIAELMAQMAAAGASPGSRLLPQADELPNAQSHLQRARALLP